MLDIAAFQNAREASIRGRCHRLQKMVAVSCSGSPQWVSDAFGLRLPAQSLAMD